MLKLNSLSYDDGQSLEPTNAVIERIICEFIHEMNFQLLLIINHKLQIS